jgi:phosphatidylinositol kinase/protein kinase (PI-3  family)
MSSFRRAQDNFLKSLASYSVICYLLQIKDRHNGNILVDREGHLIREFFRSISWLSRSVVADKQWLDIDFGFLLSNSPGSLGFEMAPFKLTQDYIDILGTRFNDFKKMLKRCFLEARRHAERIIMIVELMQKGKRVHIICRSVHGV